MSSTERIIACIVMGIVAFFVMVIAGMKPSGVVIGSVVVITGWIVSNFRDDKN